MMTALASYYANHRMKLGWRRGLKLACWGGGSQVCVCVHFEFLVLMLRSCVCVCMCVYATA